MLKIGNYYKITSNERLFSHGKIGKLHSITLAKNSASGLVEYRFESVNLFNGSQLLKFWAGPVECKPYYPELMKVLFS